ncbi:MAG: hypothetical protein P4L41_07565 [Flavipsychrobacter sp.]|nr:hypothetical protein [Flavipsychrobacter sp.]
MKYLLLLLLLPQVTIAQNFEVGILGGFNVHSRPFSNLSTLEDKSQPGYAVAAKASLLLPKAQIGLGVEMVSIQEYNYKMPQYTSREYNYIAKPLITPYLFYNIRYVSTKGYVYAGLMGGPTIAAVGVNTWQYNGYNGAVSGYSTAYNSTLGFVAGAQAGFVVRVDKHIGITGEAGLRYTQYDYKPVVVTSQENPYFYKYLYFPITAGVRYRFRT